MKRIILASASPRRRELLEQIGIKFEIRVSDREEMFHSTIPDEIVRELALQKAENVAEMLKNEEAGGQDCVIIGADTIVVRDGKILGKPGDDEEAFQMLRSLQGRDHQVFTGVALLDFGEDGRGNVTLHAEETKVFVDNMSDDEIRQYVKTGECRDKAGAYGIQGRFAAYISRIEGDYYNVVGLPVSYLYRQLRNILIAFSESLY